MENQVNEFSRKTDEDIISASNENLLNQYAKASELLNSENLSVRISKIYLFENIMNHSEEYHWNIVNIFTSFIRENRNIYKKDYYFGYIIVDDSNRYEQEIGYFPDTMIRIKKGRIEHFY